MNTDKPSRRVLLPLSAALIGAGRTAYSFASAAKVARSSMQRFGNEIANEIGFLK